MPPGDEMNDVVSRCLPHRQLWVSNLSRVATQLLEVDSNLQPFGYKAQNIPLHHRISHYTTASHTFKSYNYVSQLKMGLDGNRLLLIISFLFIINLGIW